MKISAGYRDYHTHHPNLYPTICHPKDRVLGLESEDLSICFISTMCYKYYLWKVREIPKLLEFTSFVDNGTHLPCFPVEFLQIYNWEDLVLLRICPVEKLLGMCKDKMTRKFTATPLVMGKSLKQLKCPSIEESLNMC